MMWNGFRRVAFSENGSTNGTLEESAVCRTSRVSLQRTRRKITVANQSREFDRRHIYCVLRGSGRIVKKSRSSNAAPKFVHNRQKTAREVVSFLRKSVATLSVSARWGPADSFDSLRAPARLHAHLLQRMLKRGETSDTASRRLGKCEPAAFLFASRPPFRACERHSQGAFDV